MKLTSFTFLLFILTGMPSWNASGAGPEGLEFQINSYTNQSQLGQKQATLGNGDFVLVWESKRQNSNGSGVYAQLYSAEGNKKSSEFRVGTTGQQLQPSIAAIGEQEFIIVWNQTLVGGSGVFGQKFDSNGSKLDSEFQIHSYFAPKARNPVIKALSNERFVVVWEDSESRFNSTAGYGIYGQIFDKDSSTIGSEIHINSSISQTQSRADIASLPNGGFVVYWQSNAFNNSYEIFGQSFDADGSYVGDEFQVNDISHLHQSDVSVATLDDGSHVVAWEGFDRNTSVDGRNINTEAVFMKRYSHTGDVLNDEFMISETIGSRSYGLPSVSSIGSGKFIVSWSSREAIDSSDYAIQAKIFDSEFKNILEIEQVNTADGQVFKPFRSHSSSLKGGGFIVSWQTYGQDGSLHGLYGQRFNSKGEFVELELPIILIEMTKTLIPYHDKNNDGFADRAIEFVPKEYSYRLHLRDLQQNLTTEQFRVVGAEPFWEIVDVTSALGNTSQTSSSEFHWDLVGADLSQPNQAFADVSLRESCGPVRIGGEAFLTRLPDNGSSYASVDTVQESTLCLVQLYDANKDGLIEYDGSGDENANGIDDFTEACTLNLNPCL